MAAVDAKHDGCIQFENVLQWVFSDVEKQIAFRSVGRIPYVKLQSYAG